MHAIPDDSINVIYYAFLALGNQEITFERLWQFLSFDSRQIRPSEATKLIKHLITKGSLIVNGEVLTISPHMRELVPTRPSVQLSSETQPIQELGKLLSQFVGPNRLSRAVGIDDSSVAIKTVRENPIRIEVSIQGTRVYQLILDVGAKVIQHDCPDWLRKRKLRRFCKHVAKIFLMLDKDESVRILTSIMEGSWKFEQVR